MLRYIYWSANENTLFTVAYIIPIHSICSASSPTTYSSEHHTSIVIYISPTILHAELAVLEIINLLVKRSLAHWYDPQLRDAPVLVCLYHTFEKKNMNQEQHTALRVTNAAITNTKQQATEMKTQFLTQILKSVACVSGYQYEIWGFHGGDYEE
jgi:hypothetical protein